MKPYFGTVHKVGTYVSERTHREADRVLLNRNQSLSATVAPMAKQVAREVIVTLEPIVAKHNETNQALVGEIQRVASNAGQRSDFGFSIAYTKRLCQKNCYLSVRY